MDVSWASWLLLPVLILIPLTYWLCIPPTVGTVPLASGHLPLIGHSVSYGINPIGFLKAKRAEHGDIFLVNLAVINVVFLLGPEATNQLFAGTERKGISFWAILEYMFGKKARQFTHSSGWLGDTMPLLRDALGDPERIEAWRNHCTPIARAQFKEWAESGQPISLFRGISGLAMTLLLHIFMGREFAEAHADELVPMVRAYEWALQKPQTKALPRWMSPEGKLLEAAEARMEQLIPEELKKRLENPRKYQKNVDWFQTLVTLLPLHIITLLNGGHTNQTNTFSWSLLHATRTPLLEALRQQKTSDLLDATLRETGRIYTNLMMLRRVTITQEIMGHVVPKGTFVAASPLVTARDPALFHEPDKFQPERWLTPSHTLDENAIKTAQRTATSNQFGKGQHYCSGEKLAKMLLGIYWAIILGENGQAGYDVEVVDGIVEGTGFDGVGVEAAWVEENLGTPFEKGGPLLVRFKERVKS